MRHKSLIILTILITIHQHAFTQVGIGTTTPHPKAALQIKSTTKGILFPNMTYSQRNSITAPPHGLHVFNVEERCLNYFDSIYQIWNCYCAACQTAVITINQSVCELDFYNAYAKYTPAKNYIINIPLGVTISGCNPGDTAMTFRNMPLNTEITIYNRGVIEGGGGAGGNGALAAGCIGISFPATPGLSGGYAIATKNTVPITIYNYGIVAAGGGGGGGSGANPTGYGGGGGGGAGIVAGPGGAGGGAYQYSGGPVNVCIPHPNIASPGMPGTATTGGAGGAGNSGGAPGGNGGNRGQDGFNGAGALSAPGGLAGYAIGGGTDNNIVNLAGGLTFGYVE